MSGTSALPSFFCPITFDVMRDPVTAVDGHSYERGAIERWFEDNASSPKNGGAVASKNLIPNHTLRNAIEEWRGVNCRQIPRSALTIGRQIGAGSFKKVFESELRLPGSPAPVKVAALQIRAGDVGAEIEVLLTLGRHPRLVHFIGQCADVHIADGPSETILITEFAPLGALNDIIEDVEDDITIQHKLAIMQQVASGMEALTAMNLIHRDLAIRNVLVFSLDMEDVRATSVKVSDFGLCVNGYNATHKYVSDGAKPFRWLAPEALKKNRYSQHSDVWAFAVMCWELLTNGTIPYYEIVNDDAIAAHVTRGGRLELPSDCPAQLGTIIEACWKEKAKQRPTFSLLVHDLSQLNLGPGPTKDPSARSTAPPSMSSTTELDGADSNSGADGGWNMKRLLSGTRGASSKYSARLEQLDETTSAEFIELRGKIEGRFSRGSNTRILVESIYKVNCAAWRHDFDLSCKSLPDEHVSTFLHGTGIQAVDGILAEGFRMPTSTELEELRVIAEAEEKLNGEEEDGNESDDSIDGEAMTATVVSSRPAGKLRFGPGIYFTTDVGKAAFFSEERNSTLLLVCDVAMGRTLTQDGPDTLLDAATVRRRGHDSVTKFSDRDTGRETEAVIYDPARAVVRYIVVYRGVKLQTVERQLRFETRWKQAGSQTAPLTFASTDWAKLSRKIQTGDAKEQEDALELLGSLCRDDCQRGARNLDSSISLWRRCFEIVQTSASEPIVWFTLRLFHNYAFDCRQAQLVLHKAGGVVRLFGALRSANEAIIQKAAIAMCNMSQECPDALVAPTCHRCIEALSIAGCNAGEDLTKIYVTCALRNFLSSADPVPTFATGAFRTLAAVTPKLCHALVESGYRQAMWLKSSLDFLTNLHMNVLKSATRSSTSIDIYEAAPYLPGAISEIYTERMPNPVQLGGGGLRSLGIFFATVDREYRQKAWRTRGVQKRLAQDLERVIRKVIAESPPLGKDDDAYLFWFSQTMYLNSTSAAEWDSRAVQCAARFVQNSARLGYKGAGGYLSHVLLASFPAGHKIGGVERSVLQEVGLLKAAAFKAKATGSIGDTAREN